MTQVTRAGDPINLVGDLPKAGTAAPSFTLVASDLSEITLADFEGVNLVLNIFPSIDTPTCAMSVREFNARLNALENTKVVNVSVDLPFAQTRFCAAEGLENVSNASAFRNPEFGDDYGVRMVDGALKGLYARAVVVVRDGQIVHSELVPEIKQQPNYDAAIGAIAG